MRRLRILLVLLVALDFFDPANAIFPGMFFADSAAAQTLPIPNVVPSQLPLPIMGAPLNSLIAQINGVLVPALGKSGAGIINLIGLTGGTTGTNATIGLQPGADANAGISIVPNGSGNLVLLGLSGTGVVQFGNQTSFISAPNMTPCPSYSGAAGQQGIKNTIQGTIVIKDWLGVARGLPAC